MKLAEKIMELRKANAMTQEELASICNVSSSLFLNGRRI